jgi:hypothetical protein
MKVNRPSQMLTRGSPRVDKLVDSAVFETDAGSSSGTIEDAQDAVIEEIEESFRRCRPVKRQQLIGAMNAVRELNHKSESLTRKNDENASQSRNAA